MKRLTKSLWLAALISAHTFWQPVQAQDAVKGKAVFDNNCAMCHSVTEQVVGPALKDVHKRRDEKWITSFVKNSTKMVASGDKQAVEVFEKFGKVPMTSFEGTLSDNDIKDVIAFVKAESEAPVTAEKPSAEVAKGDGTVEGGTPAVSAFSLKGMPATTLFLVAIIGFLVLLVLVILVATFFQALPILSQLYDKPGLRDTSMARVIALLRGDTTTLTGQHKDILMEDHTYDGIYEFDNDLPPWWKYMFYATIVFSVGYLLHYHVLNSGQLQDAEYQAEIQQASLLNPKSSEGNANEVTNFTPLTDAPKLEAGKAAFIQNCAACHGQNGEGTVGPNLTDEFWLHGGDVNAIYKTIKYGVTSKGMVAWQKKLSDDQILEVSSYILSIQGSKPANGKAPQGDKYEPKK